MQKELISTKIEESLSKSEICLVQDSRLTHGRTLLSMYKSPFALYLLGFSDEANQVLDWIKENTMVGPGEFREGEEPSWLSRSEVYRSSWILSAAFLLRRHDIADEAAIRRFLSFQDTTVGGFYGGREPQEAGILNTNHTAMAGIACHVMGRIDEAKKAGEYLLAHIEAQPNLKQRFVLNFHRDRGLICDYGEENRVVSEINLSGGEQLYYYLGGPMVLLCKLANLSGGQGFLDGARTLYEFTSRLPQGFASSPFSGKVAWGCAFLAVTVHEEKPWTIVERICDNLFFPKQREDGSWPGARVPFGPGYIEPSQAASAEYVRELKDILSCIKCRHSCRDRP